MNRAAKQHLAKAKEYLAKGEGFYHRAAKEIVAARDADPKVSNAEIGSWFGHTEKWVRQLMAWHASPTSRTSLPFEGDKGRDASTTKKILRDAPLEQVERIISDLPRERQRAIGAVAGDAYMRVRQDHAEREAKSTEADRKQREAARSSIGQATGRMMSGFNAFGIANYLGQATEVLREMIEEHAVTRDGLEQIETAVQEFLTEYRVARGMVGLEEHLEMR